MLSIERDGVRFDMNRCCQCGTCLAACPCGALHAEIRDDGLYVISWKNEACNGCGICVSVCPARGLSHYSAKESDWEAVLETMLGHARDEKIRAAASSGGVARFLIKAALEGGGFDAAYAVVNADSYPWAKGRMLDALTDPMQLANSIYLPLLANRQLRLIKRKPFRLLVVGTHCQLIGIERFFRKCEIEIVRIAIFCKQQKTLRYAQFIGRRLGITVGLNTPLRFRGENWPGQTRICDRSIGYEDAAGLPYGKRLWTVPGCEYCTNPLGLKADLTLADPWGIDASGPGRTLILVRSAAGRKLLDQSAAFLDCDRIDTEKARRSMGWKGVLRQQRIISLRKGNGNAMQSVLSAAGRWQRSVYELFLERMVPPTIILKILNRVPFIENYR